MKCIIYLLTVGLVATGFSSCKKCYICYGRQSYSYGGIGYKTKERIRICADKIKNNKEMDAVRDYYESQGYNCQLLTSGI